MLRHLVFIGLGASLGCAAHAGTVMEMISRDLRDDGQTTTIKTYAQDGRLRVDSTPGESTLIFRDDAIHTVNHQNKEYFVLDRAAMKRVADQINPALKQMREQLAKMPAEQRAQVEKMMGQHMPGMGEPKTQEIRNTSRRGNFAGHACSYVEVYEDGELTDELCVAPAHSFAGARELMATTEKLSTLVQEMMSGIDAPWLKQLSEQQIENYQKLGGIPVLSRHFVDGKPAGETTLKEIRDEPVAAALFEIPSGYKQKDPLARR